MKHGDPSHIDSTRFTASLAVRNKCKFTPTLVEDEMPPTLL